MKETPFAKKLPRWAEIDGLCAPPSISMEQCSSEKAASYKKIVVQRLFPQSGGAMTDLTGGYGVDFTTLAPIFKHATYVEQNAELCRIAQHNFPLLNVQSADIINGEAEEILSTLSPQDLIYLDPARRSNVGRKVLLVEDCTPNAAELMPTLLEKAKHVMIKLSPMLDITRAMQSLGPAAEVHIVAVGGECKELLLLYPCDKGLTKIICHDDRYDFSFDANAESRAAVKYTDEVKTFLYEPGAAVLKAGAFRLISERFGLEKLHPNSHLYTAEHLVEDFPGRVFRVHTVSGFGKREIRPLLAATQQANLAVRNFPGTVAELRKRFKLRDGGEDYWFATTLYNERHVIIATQKVVDCQ
jgi:hypothetical protein